MERIDAHCHFWELGRGDYHWLEGGEASLAPLRRDFGPEEMAAVNGARAVIAVQAAPTLAETRYLLGLAQSFPQIKGVIGWVDLSDPASASLIDDLALSPRLKGVRPMLQDLPEDDWIATRPNPEVIAALHAHKLRFDALVMTRHLPALTRFAEKWPELLVMIDHCAKPDLSGEGLAEAWTSGMRRLARLPQVFCKLSGLLTEMPSHPQRPEETAERLAPVFSTVLDCFGSERLVWGSDWPVLTLAAGHGYWEEVTAHLLAPLPAPQRAAILGRNAARFYGIGGADG